MRPDEGNDPRSIRERAHAYIQKKIISGDLQAGRAISELALSKELGISRTPIREAIGQLVAEGLVEQIPNRGAIVAQFGRKDVIELFELREALETYAVAKAARNGIREADAAHLREILAGPLQLKKELEKSGQPFLDGAQMQRFIAVDMAFHNLLLHAAENGRILKVTRDTRVLIRIFEFPHSGHSGEQLDQIYRQHAEILEAILLRDPATACKCIAMHIQGSREERLNAFDAYQRNSFLQGGLNGPDALPLSLSRQD